jgi:hypothetical protein
LAIVLIGGVAAAFLHLHRERELVDAVMLLVQLVLREDWLGEHQNEGDPQGEGMR